MKNKTKIHRFENILKNKLFSIDNIIDDSASQPYRIVFNYYSNNTDLESLKRAVFMQWYLAAESYQLNNLINLDTELQLQNFDHLEKLMNEKNLDQEFISMLNHYFEVCDWYFDISKKFKTIYRNSYSDNIDFNIISVNEDRGLMGTYFKSFTNNI